MDDYMKFLGETQHEFPQFKVVQKEDSLFMRVCAFGLKLVTLGAQKSFMTGYITTVGATVYVPTGWDFWPDARKLVVLRHERIHMRQARKFGLFLFALLYLLFPLPMGLSYCRARFEWEAYAESMRAQKDLLGLEALQNPKYKESIVRQFTTGAYGWMWPFRSTIESWYENELKEIEAGR